MFRTRSKTGARGAAYTSLLILLLVAPARTEAVSSALPSVALAWDSSTDPMVTGYNVYYGSATRNYTNVVSAGNTNSTVISNLRSGATYYFAATTYTADGLESDYSVEASYAVPAANLPPTLDPISDIMIEQDSGQQTVILTGITSGATNEIQTLTVSAFSSNLGLIPNPVVSYVSPETNGALIFQPVPGSFGMATITVMVDDGGATSNTVIRSFAITVNPIISRPTLDPINNLAVNENAGLQTVALSGITPGGTNGSPTLSVTAVSSNPSLVPNPTVNYSSPSTTGTLSFAAGSNAFGVATITVTVTDSQVTNNTISVPFTVTVNQVATAPTSLTNVTILPNTAFRFLINTPATNGDKWSFSLDSGAPTGAKITTRRGFSWLVWTPTTAQASTTNLIGINITDAKNPALSTNETLSVIVGDYLALALGSTSVQAGQTGTVPISLGSSDGVTNLIFSISWSANALVNPSLAVTAPGVGSSSLQNQITNLLLTVQMAPGQVLQGSNSIGSLSFRAAGTQPSGYVDLNVTHLAAAKPNSLPYANALSTAGQVAVINNLAMLQAGTAAGPTRNLTVLGRVGNSYQVQYATNVSTATVWYPLLTYSQTNIAQTIAVDATIPFVIYRVQQK